MGGPLKTQSGSQSAERRPTDLWLPITALAGGIHKGTLSSLPRERPGCLIAARLGLLCGCPKLITVSPISRQQVGKNRLGKRVGLSQ